MNIPVWYLQRRQSLFHKYIIEYFNSICERRITDTTFFSCAQLADYNELISTEIYVKMPMLE